MIKSIADLKKNGFGRDAPNVYPILEEPTGRLTFVMIILFNI
jgi:hypothetical protein